LQAADDISTYEVDEAHQLLYLEGSEFGDLDREAGRNGKAKPKPTPVKLVWHYSRPSESRIIQLNPAPRKLSCHCYRDQKGFDGKGDGEIAAGHACESVSYIADDCRAQIFFSLSLVVAALSYMARASSRPTGRWMVPCFFRRLNA
jgi:hypothetical protein